MADNQVPKIVFDPAFFESFDGDQEELDDLMKEITSMFENKTADEIKAMSKPLDWNELDEDEAAALTRALGHSDPRTLQ